MPPEVNDAFVAATVQALQELAQTETGPVPADAMAGDVFATVRLRRVGAGQLVLAFPQAVIETLARRYLPPDTALDPGLLTDLAGEFANVIAGQAKTMLQGTPYHYHLSTPATGRTAPAGGGAVLSFGTDAGAFALRVELPPGDDEA